MLTRLNFLFSVSILVLFIFGFAGRFVIIKPISAIAPGLTPYFIAAYVLATLALTALAIAKITIKLGPVSTAARSRALTARGYTAQILLCLGHACIFFLIRVLVSPENDTGHWWPWLLAPALYSMGVVIFIRDLRRRALQSTD